MQFLLKFSQVNSECIKKFSHANEKLYCAHSRLCYLSTIPLKDSHLFKIVELMVSFYL